MHTIFFGLKRAFHGTLRVTRSALTRLQLTAARFDLLYIVDKAGGEMGQRELQKALGVAASTVSRMLRSLEDLGLIFREVMLEDYRRTWVELTDAGLRAVRKAARELIRTGHVQLMVDSALCPDEWHDKTRCTSVAAACDGTLHRLRHAYRDVATLDYPKTPKAASTDVRRVWVRLLGRAGP